MEGVMVARDEAAMALALRVHGGQLDKAGDPYIGHPIRVAKKFAFGSDMYVAALLHDVVEDSDVTVDGIKQMFGPIVAALVAAVSRREDEVYMDYIDRVSVSGEGARALKLADLADNMRATRRGAIPDSLYRRYEKARDRLLLVDEEWVVGCG